jgi:hypothetical protein
MRLQIRYFRPMVYGNYTTLVFDDINPAEQTVGHLKRKIFIKMRIEPRFQKLSVKLKDAKSVEECQNDKLLSEY